MGVSFSQIAGLVLAGCLLGNASPCSSQEPGQSPPQASPEQAAVAHPMAKKPPINFELTDSGAALRATLWAVHVLRDPPGDRVSPGDIRANTGFEVTGPFFERSAGIRFEFAF